ncbi:MAG: C-GCAxxG-C-C family protein [Victivallales bacterium]
MSIVKAKEHYLGINGNKKHNCAQAVIAGFKDRFSLTDELVAIFAAHGGGKAPGGLCGALYAARHILENVSPGEMEKSSDAFIKTAGSAKCREIRSMKKLSCLACVEKAAEILVNIHNCNTVNQL